MRLISYILNAKLLLGRQPGMGPANDRVRVQHILIAFDGSGAGQTAKRDRAEAERLARELFRKARRGADFEKLMSVHSDDRMPGAYELVNFGVAPANLRELARESVAPGFADLAFGLAVGEIGWAAYDPVKCPFGFHVVKRLA